MSDLGNKKVFAENLERLMNAEGKTRNDICQALKIKYTTFADWINAKTYPRIDKIELLAAYFKVSKSDLIEKASPAGGMTGEADAQRARIEKAIAMLSEENKEQLLQYAEFLAQQEARKGGQ